MTPPFAAPAIAATFAAYPDTARSGLLALRDLIFDIADAEGISDLREVLRWRQPSYIAPKGTALRLGVPKCGGFGLYVHCGTNVIPAFAAAFPGADVLDGNRGVLFSGADQIDPSRHGLLIRHALTYKA
jgi:hypothetical protein